MTKTARPAPFFLAEDQALDFLNTIGAPWGSDIEWIRDGRDLLDWLELAGLVPTSVVKQFRKENSKEELDAVAAQARELREWFRAFVAEHAGRSLPAKALDDLGTLNRLLARDDCYRQIEVSSAASGENDPIDPLLRWRQERRWRSPEALLLPIAEAIGDLVSTADFARVKMCDGPTCTMWFHDFSQNHSRRWCNMAVCGNRAKAAAHRARKKATQRETTTEKGEPDSASTPGQNVGSGPGDRGVTAAPYRSLGAACASERERFPEQRFDVRQVGFR